MHTSMLPIRRIAIIGAGPTGIACAKYFHAEQVFAKIDVFEQRDNVGGIWNLSGNRASSQIPVPQTDPDYGAGGSRESMSLEFESPLYDYLETNIPKFLMAYSDMPFASKLPLFPKNHQVQEYLEKYAEPVRNKIHFNTQVINVEPIDAKACGCSSLNQKWNVASKDLTTGESREQQYDAVVAAVGHYTVPHIPYVAGLEAFARKHPGTVMHSKAYRRPEDYKNYKILVIGNSASGLDIAGQLAGHAQHPIYLASRSASQLAPKGGGPRWRKDVMEIECFLTNRPNGAVRTVDGEVIEDLDKVIFATGYFFSFPFLSQNMTSSSSSSSAQSPSSSTSSIDSPQHLNHSARSKSHTGPLANLTTSGLRVHHIYKHFLNTEYPTLALPVLNLKIIPFPLAENQAAVLARLWSGRLDMPSRSEMRQWEHDEEQRLLKANRLRAARDTASGDTAGHGIDSGKTDELKYEGGFHTLVYPEDANQLNSLFSWTKAARRKDGLENNGEGKLGTRWDEESVWLRGRFPDIKAAYTKHGEKRFDITSLSQLGEEWQNAYKNWSATTSEDEKRDLFGRAAVEGY